MGNPIKVMLAASVLAGASVVMRLFEGWRRLRYARTLALKLDRHQPSPTTPEPAPHPDMVDLGVGEGAFVSVATSGPDPYRATELRQVRVTGDPMDTYQVLHSATSWLVWSLPVVVTLAAALVLGVVT